MALRSAIKRAKAILKERVRKEEALPSITIQFGGHFIPALPGTETIHFKIRPAVREIKITRGIEPLHSTNDARLK